LLHQLPIRQSMKDRVILTTAQKALKINLNSDIYGTFAEIGAGQETVREFFRAGAASGTIAKAMSAYDKAFSDDIYGIEEDRRYVTESRLRKMLKHEYNLIEKRFDRNDHPKKTYFRLREYRSHHQLYQDLQGSRLDGHSLPNGSR
jgi:hypothetical protein